MSFEAYCTGELHIRRATAEKLLRSYGFLRRHEREESEASERAPAFEVVTVLADAEERGQLTERDYARVRDSIWDPGRTPAELRRELTERFPVPERSVDRRAELKRFAATAPPAGRRAAGEPPRPGCGKAHGRGPRRRARVAARDAVSHSLEGGGRTSPGLAPVWKPQGLRRRGHGQGVDVRVRPHIVVFGPRG